MHKECLTVQRFEILVVSNVVLAKFGIYLSGSIKDSNGFCANAKFMSFHQQSVAQLIVNVCRFILHGRNLPHVIDSVQYIFGYSAFLSELLYPYNRDSSMSIPLSEISTGVKGLF